VLTIPPGEAGRLFHTDYSWGRPGSAASISAIPPACMKEARRAWAPAGLLDLCLRDLAVGAVG
jgi:hypothetical protein